MVSCRKISIVEVDTWVENLLFNANIIATRLKGKLATIPKRQFDWGNYHSTEDILVLPPVYNNIQDSGHLENLMVNNFSQNRHLMSRDNISPSIHRFSLVMSCRLCLVYWGISTVNKFNLQDLNKNSKVRFSFFDFQKTSVRCAQEKKALVTKTVHSIE